MEKYRSGHNGPDSKSGNPLTGTVGSNPTFSATRQGPGAIRAPGFFRIQKGNPRPAQAFQPLLHEARAWSHSRSRLFPCPKGKPASCASVSTGCCTRQGPGAIRAPGFFRVQKGSPRPAQAFQPLLHEAKNPSGAPKSTTPLPFGRGAGSAGGRRRPCSLLLRNRDFGRGGPWGNPQREWEMARPCFSNPRAA